MTYILQIDTSSHLGVVAITADGKPISVLTNEQGRNHAADIHHMIASVLQSAQIEITQLNAISVIAGPGSYTGLRIGMSIAKGFCYALDIPLMVHNKLTLLIQQKIAKEIEDTGVFYAIIVTARVHEYFVACYDFNMQVVREPQHMAHDVIATWLQDETHNLVVLTDLAHPETIFAQKKFIKYYPVEIIDIETWGVSSYLKFTNIDFADIALAIPFYMKDVYINKSK